MTTDKEQGMNKVETVLEKAEARYDRHLATWEKVDGKPLGKNEAKAERAWVNLMEMCHAYGMSGDDTAAVIGWWAEATCAMDQRGWDRGWEAAIAYRDGKVAA
jgi:hypothetical protein